MKLPRFSVRTLLIFLLTVALVLGMFVVPGLRQSRCAAVLLDLGALLEYGKPIVPVPDWSVDLIGYHFFQPITRVSFAFEVEGFSAKAGTVRIVESPEKSVLILRQLHSLSQVTVSTVHHAAIVEQLQRELPGVKVITITLASDAVVQTGTWKTSETLNSNPTTHE